MVVASSTFSAPTEGIILETPGTKLLVNDQDLGTATMYITENTVVWGGGVGATGGPSPVITLLYPKISIHAIQRNPSPSLYMIVNYDLKVPELGQEPADTNDDDDDDFDVEDQFITQLRFIPQNEGDLQAMFSALTQGQVLNPNPSDSFDVELYEDGEEFEEEEDEFEDAEEANGAPEEAAARLHQMRLDNTNGVHYEDCEDSEIEED